MRKDFKFFNADSNNRKMTKIRDKKVDKAYEVYFAIYQGVTGQVGFADTYKEFSPDFFDLIIVDECHRGSAKTILLGEKFWNTLRTLRRLV